jgi:phytoene dehydrogenase-like protein
MPPTLIIGGGLNGLTCAFYLARAGLQPIVLERREVFGGGAITLEIHRGFRAPALAHALGPLAADVVGDLELLGRRIAFLEPEVRVFAPLRDGGALALSDDPARTADAIRPFSPKDAARYGEYVEAMAKIGAFLATLIMRTPPALDTPSAAELWRLLTTGLKFRQLGRANAHRLLRWGPMAVADLVGEWFDFDPLRACLAAPAIHGAMLGPWSAGSSARLLMQTAFDAIGRPGTSVAGGPGALAHAVADAARDAGATIRTGAEVREILVEDGRVRGVALASGETIDARAVVSNADPRRTFLSLVDPAHLTPDFLTKIRQYRARGVVAKVNLAVSALPSFAGVKSGATAGPAHPLAGRVHIGPEIDYLERAFDAAKYGCYSDAPYLDVTIPTLMDPSLAPAGAHVMSVHMQYAPFTLRESDWNAERERLGDLVVATLAAYAPDLPRLVVARQVITPADLEREYGFTGGDIHHGEMSIDQLFAMRPLLGWAQYRTPIDGLFLCGAGTHPAGGLTGLPGRNAARQIARALKSAPTS